MHRWPVVLEAAMAHCIVEVHAGERRDACMLEVAPGMKLHLDIHLRVNTGLDGEAVGAVVEGLSSSA